VNRSVGAALAFLGFVFFSTATPAVAQTPARASLGGIVDDLTGGVIPGATITVVAVSDGHTVATTTTNVAGAWEVSLDPGTYRVSVALQGFKTIRHGALVVGEGRSVRLATTLEIDPHAMVSEFDPHPSLTGDYSQGDESVIAALPLFKRNAMYFVALLPGINTNPRYALQQATMFGLAAAMTGLYLDGVGIKPPAERVVTPESFATVIRPSPDLIGDMSVGPHLPGGDASSRLPTAIQFVTRANVNLAKGSAYLYSRPTEQVLLNDFGVRSGGPVVLPHLFDGHGRVFYQLGYEEERLSALNGRTAEHLFGGRVDADVSSRVRVSTSVGWQGDRWRLVDAEESTDALVAQTNLRATLTNNILNEATVGVAHAQMSGSDGSLTEASDTLTWAKGPHILTAGIQSRVSQPGEVPNGATAWVQDRWHARWNLTIDAGIRHAAPHINVAWQLVPEWDWLRALTGDPLSAVLLAGCARLDVPDGGHSCSIGFQRSLGDRAVIFVRQLDVDGPGLGYRLTEVSYRRHGLGSELSASYSHQSSREGADIPAHALKGFGVWQIPAHWSLSVVGRLEHAALLDMSIRKSFPLGPRGSVECGLEIFNVTNSDAFSKLNSVSNSNVVAFHDQTDQFDPAGRVAQVVLRVNW
jgi:hypothetical protein